ncbi:hypothetical protein [uncultured Stenotrophomonas sp.]|uniref:hypothetical protein n=1 Tax=uncultured Stenotrophomonas sp. TaxID=165438 RepID=UPI0025DB8DBB|nr:hypothetical protein [uncultured Stenotrophomonas sp.]
MPKPAGVQVVQAARSPWRVRDCGGGAGDTIAAGASSGSYQTLPAGMIIFPACP